MFNEKGSDDVKALAALLESCVETAKSIVDSNPMLKNVPDKESGYLESWIKTFTEFSTNNLEGTGPSFSTLGMATPLKRWQRTYF